jgi:acyl carrier protein
LINITKALSHISIAIEQDSTMNDTKQKILETFSAIFDINLADIPENASPDLIDKWDSVNHMNLILALEEEFGIRFSDDELTQLLDFNIIYGVISSKV